MKKNYDVIIVGAGPAGLSVGSELSKDLDVLIIDKKKELNYTSKSWFVPDAAIKAGDADDIRPSLYNGIGRFFTSTYSGADVLWDSYQYYPFVDEKSILQYWGDICKKNGADIALGTLCEDFNVTKEGVEVYTTKEDGVTAKLLIDGSGTNSFIKKKFKMKDSDIYYWSVYGAIVEFEDGVPEGLKVGDYQLWQTFRTTNVSGNASMASGRPILEYEILNEKQAFIFIFFLKKDLVEADIMKIQFEAIMEEPTVTEYFSNIKYVEPKFGWYPSGGSKSTEIARDRVSFIGDAGVWTTPCGWGMTTIIANYKRYANNLMEKFKEDKLSKRHLKDIVEFDIYTENQFNIDQLVTHFLAHSSSGLLDKFIEMFDPKKGAFGEKGPLYCEKVFTLSLNDDDIDDLLVGVFKHFEIVELLKIMPKKDILILLDTIKDLTTVTILEEGKSLVNKLFGKEIFKPKFEDGFTFGD